MVSGQQSAMMMAVFFEAAWVVCIICCLFVFKCFSFFSCKSSCVRVPAVFYLNMSKKGKKQDMNDDRSKRHLKNIILLNIDLRPCVCACVRVCVFVF